MIYKYKVISPLENLSFLQKTKVYNISVSDNIIFYTNNLKDIKAISSNCLIDNQWKRMFLNFLKKYLVTIIGSIILLIVFFTISRTITAVEVLSDYNNKNDQEIVYDYVCNKLKYYGRFAYLKEDILTINTDLRKQFYYLQWISVEKRGTVLLIKISKTSEEYENEEKNAGSLYSKYDAYIKGYYVKKGQVLIKNNMSVTIGDELISGNIVLYDNKNETVAAEGYVIGEVIETKTYTIPKISIETKKTGRIVSHYLVEGFGKVLNQKDIPFENYETTYQKKVSMGKIFNIYLVTYYELTTDKKEYQEDDAIKYAESIIRSEALSEKKYDFERIISINLLNNKLITTDNEEDDYYEVSFIVKSIKDITYFEEFKVN